ncbi:hypothetical protein [Serinicoccus kebangsaanensis]|uniref:hypothetical protein n=1 Tax=Serinicoccus kebangsaanensis TaxID=2602069 RepID=UPI00124D9319|nr:hypothetical protein [Serinicoccus kebangsaanensis]
MTLPARTAAATLIVASLLAACGGEPEVPAESPEGAVDAEVSAGGAAPEDTADDVAVSAPASDASDDDALAGLADVDLGETVWIFRPGANLPESVQVPLSGGSAQVDGVSYTLGEVLTLDLSGDGVEDAAAQLTRLDGNAVDDQWYLWIATDDGPVQVTLPVARTAGCGTVTESVTVVDEGLQIHEYRRGPGEDGLACSERGSDERTRVIAAVEARNAGEWWPVQVAPEGGFGGLCPTATDLDGFPHDGALYAAPDTSAPEITGGEPVGVASVEAWPVYGEPFGAWLLLAVMDIEGGNLRCAWSEVSG